MPVSDKENNAEFLFTAQFATKGRFLPPSESTTG
jgi:hypothetical protein